MYRTRFDLNPQVITQVLSSPTFKETSIKNIGEILKSEFITDFPNKHTVSVSVDEAVNQAIKDMANTKMGIDPNSNVSEEAVKHFNPSHVSINQDGLATGGLIHGTPVKWSNQLVELKISNEAEINESRAMLGKPAEMHNVISGYEPLGSVLALALEQAQSGKGSQRHQVGDMPFIKQPICELARMYGVGYNFGQAAKKAHETQQLTSLKAKQAELLGAINYLAAAYIVISEQE